jgi:WD40 repeat protein
MHSAVAVERKDMHCPVAVNVALVPGRAERHERKESGKTSLNELRQNAGEIVVLAFSPDRKILLTASHDGTARFLDAESGTQLGPALHRPDAVLCVASHPDGQSAVTGTKDGMVQRWSAPAPLQTGGVAEIGRWVKEQTRMELDDQGAVAMGSLCN